MQKLNVFGALADCVGLGAGFVQNFAVLQPVLCTKYCFVQHIQDIRNIALYKIFKILLCTKFGVLQPVLQLLSPSVCTRCTRSAFLTFKSVRTWPSEAENQLNIGISLRIHITSGYYKCNILPDCTIHVLQGGKSFD